MGRKTWFKAVNLLGLAGLPHAYRGLNLLGEREGWKRRKVIRRGGPPWEYHISGLPQTVAAILLADQAATRAEEATSPVQGPRVKAVVLQELIEAIDAEISDHVTRI